MKHLRLFTFVFIPFLMLLFFSSCVSKKKYLEAIQIQMGQSDSLNMLLQSCRETVQEKNLDIARRMGENDALLATQNKMLDRIQQLDDELEQLANSATSDLESAEANIKSKEAEIAQKQQKIEELKALLNDREAAMNQLLLLIKDTLTGLKAEQLSVENVNGKLSISFSMDFLFSKGSTTKFLKDGEQALEKLCDLLNDFPSLDILVIGHTDNKPTNRNSISDNWQYSALQAVSVVRAMTERYDVSTSRISAVGKGEYAPRASNTSAQGQALNRRIEVLVYLSDDRLLRDLNKKL
ncbi:MAG TPA: OmpA family protein [Saprospiraceae bacterium]|nr:OmpA family protein [Saprospiraceae bacterium]HMQ85574.1 OmpA family protein [Saprospiraceae bacterium]